MPVATMPIEEKRKIWKAQECWKNNPVDCASQFFGGRLWTKQQEVMNAIRDYKRVAVKSGNTVGKSHIVAKIALTYLLSYYPSKVITTAPTFTQIESIIWKEIAHLYHNSKIPIGGDLLKTELKLTDDWFAMGISTNEVNRFQGFHSPHLLVIIDEALGVAPEIWEAIDGLHPHRVIAIGNPLSPEGNFFNCFSSELWHKITISCMDCVKWQNENGAINGLVTLDWIEERAKEWGKHSPLYLSRVLGEFPQEGTDTLIHLNWVDNCFKKEPDHDEMDMMIISGDIARYGEDKTVILDRKGHTLLDFEIKEKIPTTMTAGIIKRHYELKRGDSLVVDDSGVGGGVTDMLTNFRLGVLGFNGGYKQKAIDKNRFSNLRSQFYWIMAKKFEKGMYSLKLIPRHVYDVLKSQLCSIKYKIDLQGKIKVESKDDMKARGLVSPDLADTVMMSEYAFWCGKYQDVKPYCYR